MAKKAPPKGKGMPPMMPGMPPMPTKGGGKKKGCK